MILVDVCDHKVFSNIEVLHDTLYETPDMEKFFIFTPVKSYTGDIEIFSDPYVAYRRGLMHTNDLEDCEFMWYNSKTKQYFKGKSFHPELVFVQEMLLLSHRHKTQPTYGSDKAVVFKNYYCRYEVENGIYSLEHSGKANREGENWCAPFSCVGEYGVMAAMQQQGLFGYITKHILTAPVTKLIPVVQSFTGANTAKQYMK